MSKMRRPHLGFGHFAFSIDNRLPALICNKGNQPVTASSLLSFVLYSFSSCSPIPQSAGKPGDARLLWPIRDIQPMEFISYSSFFG